MSAAVEFVFGTTLLKLADPRPVPPTVAKCPECGGALHWQATTTDVLIDLALDCENEPDLDSDEVDGHRFFQSDWQPVIDAVRDWLKRAAFPDAKREAA